MLKLVPCMQYDCQHVEFIHVDVACLGLAGGKEHPAPPSQAAATAAVEAPASSAG